MRNIFIREYILQWRAKPVIMIFAIISPWCTVWLDPHFCVMSNTQCWRKLRTWWQIFIKLLWMLHCVLQRQSNHQSTHSGTTNVLWVQHWKWWLLMNFFSSKDISRKQIPKLSNKGPSKWTFQTKMIFNITISYKRS